MISPQMPKQRVTINPPCLTKLAEGMTFVGAIIFISFSTVGSEITSRIKFSFMRKYLNKNDVKFLLLLRANKGYLMPGINCMKKITFK